MKFARNLAHDCLNTGEVFFAVLLLAMLLPLHLFSQQPASPPYGLTADAWEKLHRRPVRPEMPDRISQLPENAVFANGSFESGDFSGWVVQDLSEPFYPLGVEGAGINVWPDFFSSDPPDGNFAALHGFDGNGPGLIRIAQDVSLPAEAQTVEFDYRAAWDLLNYGAALNRYFMVNIEPAGGGAVLHSDTVLTALAGTLTTDTGDLHGWADVSSFAGSTVRISFDWEVPEYFVGPGFFQLDNVHVLPVGPGPQIAVNPGGRDFGIVPVGNSSAPVTVTIRSVGTASLTVSAIINPGSPFILDSLPSLPAVIPPGGTATFQVTFSPTAAGMFNAMIDIGSDDPDDPLIQVSLSGQGLLIQPAEPGVCYASTGNIDGGRLIAIDLASGAGTLIGPTGLGAVPGLAINSGGEIFGVAAGSFDLYRIDAASGTAVWVGPTGLDQLPAIAFDGSDVLYGLGFGASSGWQLYTIDTATGAVTAVAPAFGGGNWRGMAFDPFDGVLWASTTGDDIYTINIQTGAATLIGYTQFSLPNPDIQFDNQGNLYAIAGGSGTIASLLAIDKTNGAGTLIGSVGFNSVSGMAMRLQQLPGPQIGIFPGSINFGKVAVNTVSAPRTVTIRSIGTDNLTVSAISDPGAPFVLENLPTLPAVIPPGGIATFQVRLAPTATGTFSAVIDISSDDPDDPLRQISLSGEGLVIEPALPGVCYASTGNIDGGRLITIDLASGAGTLVGPTGLEAVPGLAINAGGEIFGISSGNFALHRINASDGTALLVGATGLNYLPAIAFDGAGVLYGLGIAPPGFDWQLFTIDTGSGSASAVASLSIVENWRGMSFNPLDGALWASTVAGDLYTIDPLSGNATYIGNTQLLTGLPDIQFDDEGTLFGAAGGDGAISILVSIDQGNGLGTVVGPTGFSSVSGMAMRLEPLTGPHIGVSPAGIGYGKVAVNSSSAPRTVTIRSVGSQDLTVSAISDPGAHFLLENLPTLPAVIPPGGMASFQVSFTPASAGNFSAVIEISSDDPDDPLRQVSLSGEGVAIRPAEAGICYASTGNIDGGRLIAIDLASGAGTLLGPTGLNAVPGLAINSSGDIFGVEDGSIDLYRIDAASGTAIRVGPTGLSFLPAIAFDGADVLYGLGSAPPTFDWQLYTIDPASGTATAVTTVSGGDNWRGMSFNPSDGTLWASTSGDDIYTIDPASGAATLIGFTQTGLGNPDIQFDNQGTLYGAAGGGGVVSTLIAIDKTTAQGSAVGPIGFRSVSGMAMRITQLAGPHIALIPPAIDYGKIAINSSSLPRTVTIYSVGSQALTVSDITVSGAPFELSNLPSLPAVIPPGGAASFQATFSPTAAGNFNGMIEISSDDPDDPLRQMTLSGEALAPPARGTLFASTAGAEMLVVIDPASGIATPVGSTFGFGGITEIEFRRDGVLFGATGGGSSSILTIDIFSGAVTLLGGHDFGAINGMEFSPGGRLLGTFITGPGTNSQLVEIDQNDASLTYIGSTGYSNIGGLSFSPDGILYGITSGGGAGELVTIDTLTGAATSVGLSGFFGVGSLEFSFDGTLYAGVGQGDPTYPGYLLTIDPLTGAGTPVGASGFSTLSGLSFYPGPPVGIDPPASGALPETFALFQNYPNPFNPATRIRFALPQAAPVTLEIFNLLGERVAVLLHEPMTAGYHTVSFDAGRLASGVYFYALSAGKERAVRKMLLLK